MGNAVAFKDFLMEDIFDIVKGKRLTKEDQTVGNTLFIGATAENHGQTARIGQEPLFPANTITVSYNGSVGEAFYQEEPYWASDDINVLFLKDYKLNKYIALYLCATIRKAGKLFYYNQKWNLERMKVTKISLPVTSEDLPDWNYMEKIIKEIEIGYIRDLDAYLIASKLNDYELNEADKQVLVIKPRWKEFKIGDLFEPLKVGYIGKGKKIGSATKEPDAEHCVPLTCAKIGDNGIMYWGKPGDFITYVNTLSVIADGAVSAGLVYAQPEEAGAYSHSYFIKVKDVDVSKYVNIYLSEVLTKKIYPKYSREDAPRWNKIENDVIMLPVKEDDMPNWDYMEKYIYSIEKLAIAGVVSWKNEMIANV